MRPPAIAERVQVACAVVAALLLLGTLSRVMGPLIRASRAPEFVAQEMVYFPSGHFLGPVSAGQRQLVADALWLRAVQYYGSHRQTDRQYTWAKHIFRVIGELNPHYVEAIRFGALVLATDVGDVDGAIDLLKGCFHENPDSWEVAFDLGFVYYLKRSDGLAGLYFRRAAALPGAPEQAGRFAAFAMRRAGRAESAREMWTALRDGSTNPASRQIAEYMLRNLDLDDALEALETAGSAFRAERGRPPVSVDELVRSGRLARPPADPSGRGFAFDPMTGRALALFRIEEQIERTLASVRQTLLLYRQERGAFPDSLEKLVKAGYMTGVPLPDGFSVRYNPADGAVVAVPPPHLARIVRMG